MKRAKKPKRLSYKQKLFCNQYVIHKNATVAYMAIYCTKSETTARSNGSRLLTNANIQAYIDELLQDVEALTGVTMVSQVLEYKKIAYSNMSQIFESWIDLKDFEKLPESVLACIESIQYRTRTFVENDEPVQVDEVKIKPYNKLSALDSISKILGIFAPDKLKIEEPDNTRKLSNEELKERLILLRQAKNVE